jgi:hypothetical protein
MAVPNAMKVPTPFEFVFRTGVCAWVWSPRRISTSAARAMTRSATRRPAERVWLRAILNTAGREDEILRQNPCRISGYDQYHTPERTTASIDQVHALADAMPDRFRR